MFFTHVHKPIIIFCQIFFDLSLSLSFFPLPFFFISSFVTHFIVFLLHGIVAGQLFRKSSQSSKYTAKLAVDFVPKCYLFCQCNSVRITQNIQNVTSLERSIFADVVAYQFINFEKFTWQNVTPAKRVTRSGRPDYPPWRVTPPIM